MTAAEALLRWTDPEAQSVFDGRPFPTALVQIEFSTVSEWAHTTGEVFTTFDSLVALDVVGGLIRDELAKANARLEGTAEVRDVRLVPRELRGSQGELTPNGRVKRDVVVANFSSLVDEMYAGASTST